MYDVDRENNIEHKKTKRAMHGRVARPKPTRKVQFTVFAQMLFTPSIPDFFMIIIRIYLFKVLRGKW
jgi:hypothetical protein